MEISDLDKEYDKLQIEKVLGFYKKVQVFFL